MTFKCLRCASESQLAAPLPREIRCTSLPLYSSSNTSNVTSPPLHHISSGWSQKENCDTTFLMWTLLLLNWNNMKLYLEFVILEGTIPNLWVPRDKFMCVDGKSIEFFTALIEEHNIIEGFWVSHNELRKFKFSEPKFSLVDGTSGATQKSGRQDERGTVKNVCIVMMLIVPNVTETLAFATRTNEGPKSWTQRHQLSYAFDALTPSNRYDL